MLNAKSGIAELLQPMGGSGTSRRQEAVGQDNAGLFGDTLKGQMNRTAEQRQAPPARTAEKPAGTEKSADSAAQEAATPEAKAPAATVTEAEEATPVVDTSATKEVTEETVATAPIILLFPQETVAEPRPVLPEGDAALPLETADSGNNLPPALPLLAADAAPEAVTADSEDAELPRWMHSLAAAGRGREQAVAGRVTQEPVVTAAEGEDAPQDGAFLKGLQAVTAQLDSQRNDTGSRQGQGQGYGAEALFKLAGLTAQKEVAPPPMNMAASTVSAAAAATAAPAPAPAAAPAQTLALDVPLRQAGWDQAMAERVVWMAKQGVQEAQIHLNPRNMGPIEVHVSVQKDQASVAFVAQHAATREALDAAMPRLRDMLQDSGLNLAQSEVSQHDRQRDQAAGFAGGQERGQHGRGDGAAADDAVVAETPLRGGGLGAVDYYA